MECVCVPSLPPIVNVYDPVGVDPDVLMFNVEPLPGLTGFDVNVPFAPEGRPETLSVIGAESPLRAVVLTE